MKNIDQRRFKTFYYKGSQLIEEMVEGEAVLHMLYHPVYGWFLRFLFVRYWFCWIVAWYYQSSRSKKLIQPFIKKYTIELNDFQEPSTGYSSFNDFFIRKLKPGARVIEKDKAQVVSPADSKVLVYPCLQPEMVFFVKQLPFTLDRFLANDNLTQRFEAASMMLFRLAPYDYHRFHMPIDGTLGRVHEIQGKYHSVNPFVYKRGIQPLMENKRIIIPIYNEELGTILMIPVGAMLVSRMVITAKEGNFLQKGDEVGYFEFGGSTLVLLFPKDGVSISKTVIDNTNNGFETAVVVGEKVAYINKGQLV